MYDADTCRMIFGKTKQRIEDLDADIKRELAGLNNMQDRIDRISSVLDEVRGEIRLRDLLENESEQLIDKTFTAEGDTIDQALGEVDRAIEAAGARMKECSSANGRKQVLEFYRAQLLAFCAEPGVVHMPDKLQGSGSPVIAESGSSKPRLMLAFHYAVLHATDRFSPACFCPVIVDTPSRRIQTPRTPTARRRGGPRGGAQAPRPVGAAGGTGFRKDAAEIRSMQDGSDGGPGGGGPEASDADAERAHDAGPLGPRARDILIRDLPLEAIRIKPRDFR